MDEKQNKDALVVFPESLTLGYLTLLGYLLAFVYEYSFSSFYGIPYFFIDITLTNIFVSVFSIFVFVFLVRQSFAVFETLGLVSDTSIGWYRVMQLLTVLLLSPLLITSYFKDDYKTILIVAGYLVFSILFEVLATLFHGRNISTWKEKRKKLEEVWSDKTRNDKGTSVVTNKIFTIFFPITQRSYIKVLMTSLMLCIITFSMGRFNAVSKEKYYTLSNNPQRVVVTQYGGSIFTVLLDVNSLYFNADILIIGKDELNNEDITLVYKKLGRLRAPELIKGN